jgi:hypothetical protein
VRGHNAIERIYGGGGGPSAVRDGLYTNAHAKGNACVPGSIGACTCRRQHVPDMGRGLRQVAPSGPQRLQERARVLGGRLPQHGVQNAGQTARVLRVLPREVVLELMLLTAGWEGTGRWVGRWAHWCGCASAVGQGGWGVPGHGGAAGRGKAVPSAQHWHTSIGDCVRARAPALVCGRERVCECATIARAGGCSHSNNPPSGRGSWPGPSASSPAPPVEKLYTGPAASRSDSSAASSLAPPRSARHTQHEAQDCCRAEGAAPTPVDVQDSSGSHEARAPESCKSAEAGSKHVGVTTDERGGKPRLHQARSAQPGIMQECRSR